MRREELLDESQIKGKHSCHRLKRSNIHLPLWDHWFSQIEFSPRIWKSKRNLATCPTACLNSRALPGCLALLPQDAFQDGQFGESYVCTTIQFLGLPLSFPGQSPAWLPLALCFPISALPCWAVWGESHIPNCFLPSGPWFFSKLHVSRICNILPCLFCIVLVNLTQVKCAENLGTGFPLLNSVSLPLTFYCSLSPSCF